jgi:glycosyltransferase involved in cell wall biosynthesis
MLDPGNFIPYYVDKLCRGLREELDLAVRVITSPPLFERVDPEGLYEVDPLFFPRLDGRKSTALRRLRRVRQAMKAASYPAGLLRTWRALVDGPAGVLHVQFALVPALDCVLLQALKRRGWRVVYTAHDAVPEPKRAAHRAHGRLLALADAVIVHTRRQARQVAGAYAQVTPRLHVIAHGADIFPLPAAAERREARRRIGVEPDRPFLLHFGMLKPYKGIEYLVAAMPDVLARFPSALLVIAGAPLMPLGPLRRQIAQLGLGSAVSLRPRFVPTHEVAQYMRAADVVIAPYVQIGASGVIPLAQGHGRPVIVTRVGGLPEFVEDDESGFVVPERSPAALADAIARGLRDPEALADMGRRGWARVGRERRWSDVARQTYALYDPAGARDVRLPRAGT